MVMMESVTSRFSQVGSGNLEMGPFSAAASGVPQQLQLFIGCSRSTSAFPVCPRGASWHIPLPQLLVFREKPGTAALDAEGSVEQLPRIAPASSRACAT